MTGIKHLLSVIDNSVPKTAQVLEDGRQYDSCYVYVRMGSIILAKVKWQNLNMKNVKINPSDVESSSKNMKNVAQGEMHRKHKRKEK